MGQGAPPPLDAFYIQQASGSFGVPLDVPDVNSYDHTGAAGGALSSNGLPVRGPPPSMSGWGAPSRPGPPPSAHDVQPHEEADVLHPANHGYPGSLSSGIPPMPGSARTFPASIYRPTDPTSHRHMMMESDAARVPRPMQKRQRMSPVPFNDGLDIQSRFRRAGAGPMPGPSPGVSAGPPPGPGRPRLPSRGIPTRRDLDGVPHTDGFPDLLSDPQENPGAPSNDLTSWILGPDDAPQRPQTFSIDPSAYYQQGLTQPSTGLRIDMPGLATPQQALDAPKGLAPIRSQGPSTDEEPLYVNAKQYQRILKRRMARARMEEKRRHMFMLAIKQREEEKNGGTAEISEEWVSGLLALDEEAKKPYLHESRHKHAMRRPRGPGGRFLTTEEIRKRDEELAAQKAQAETPSATNGDTTDSPSQAVETESAGASTTMTTNDNDPTNSTQQDHVSEAAHAVAS